MIANDRRRSPIADRRRSQRELFPYNRRRSQTIAEPTVAIHFVQRKCQMYSRVALVGKSKQRTWRTSRRKFRCKRRQRQLQNGRKHRKFFMKRQDKLNFSSTFSQLLAVLFLSMKILLLRLQTHSYQATSSINSSLVTVTMFNASHV